MIGLNAWLMTIDFKSHRCHRGRKENPHSLRPLQLTAAAVRFLALLDSQKTSQAFGSSAMDSDSFVLMNETSAQL
jgi:hypothetical protein